MTRERIDADIAHLIETRDGLDADQDQRSAPGGAVHGLGTGGAVGLML